MAWPGEGEIRQPVMTKEQAGYVSPSPFPNQCGNCIMFKSGSCDLVTGVIEQGAVCTQWAPEADV